MAYNYKDEDLALFSLLAQGSLGGQASTANDLPYTSVPSAKSTGALNSLSSSGSYTPSAGSSGSYQSLGLPGPVASGAGILSKIAMSGLGMPSMVYSPLSAFVKSYVGDTDQKSMAQNVGNAALGAGLSALIPGLGTALTVGNMFGLNLMRGLGNLVSPNQEVPASWNGGFFDKGYTPPDGSIMSSGNRNYSPYGGLSLGDFTTNTTGYDSGHAYGASGNAQGMGEQSSGVYSMPGGSYMGVGSSPASGEGGGD